MMNHKRKSPVLSSSVAVAALLRRLCSGPSTIAAFASLVAFFILAEEAAAAFSARKDAPNARSANEVGKASAVAAVVKASSVDRLEISTQSSPVIGSAPYPRSGDNAALTGARGGDDPCQSRRGFLRTSAMSAVLCAEPGGVSAAGRSTAGSESDSLLGSSSKLAASTFSSAAAPPGLGAPVDYQAILKKSAKRALGGGTAGASAALVQVFSLMWLRTAMNYQYRYGGDLLSSLRTLTSEGGFLRLYQGLPFALVQGPLTRFGDTAANVGILALLESTPETASLPLPLKTLAGSVFAGLWRIFLMPIDTSKTAMQVEGAEGLSRLRARVMAEGPSPLYQGALASAAATAAGHYPWFLTYNFLNEGLPAVSKEELFVTLVRSAFLGLSASCVSDCVSNSLRVIKTTKQTAGLGSAVAKEGAPAADGSTAVLLSKGSDLGDEKDVSAAVAQELTYREALDLILEKDGVRGLFGRGLKTRLLTNAIQGAAFSVLWKYFQTVGGQQ